MANDVENILYKDLAAIIENGKQQVVAQVNSVLTITYWHIGKKINEHILQNERAEYGKQIVPPLATQLTNEYGNSFTLKNLYRMMQFADVFPDIEIVVTLSRQLSWSHFTVLIPLKEEEERNFYAQKIVEERWSVRATRHQISRKAYERNEIASLQIQDDLSEMRDTFKDPYFLDFLGLKNGI